MSMVFELHDLIIDPARRTVRRGDEALKLQDLTFELLLGLVQSAPEPLGLEALAERVWKAPHVSNDTIAQRIALLRKALGDDPRNPQYIRTVRGAGYGVIGLVTERSGSPDPLAAEPRPVRPVLPVRLVMVVTVLAIGALGLGALFVWLTSSQPAAKTTQISAQTSANSVLIQRAKEQLGLHQPEETERAVAMLRTAVERDPESFEARLGLSFALVTSATKFRGDLDEKLEAEALARQLLKEQPENSDAWSALGYVLSSMGRGDEALAAYRQSITFNPDNASARSSAAHLLLLKGDLQQALLLDWEARERGGNSKYSEVQIGQALDLIEHPASLWWQEQALILNPGQAVVVKEVALSKLRMGDPKAALDLIMTYDGAAVTSPQLLALKGRVLLILGDEPGARAALSQAGWRGEFLLAALAGRDGGEASIEDRFPAERRMELAGTMEPDLLVQLAEIEASVGAIDKSAQIIATAVGRGWRDTRWLERSPFLAPVLTDARGRASLERIDREVRAQRELIENTRELASVLARRTRTRTLR